MRSSLGILYAAVWHMQVLILLTSLCVMFYTSELSSLFAECLDEDKCIRLPGGPFISVYV
jgi:hypothetical protein